MLFGCMVGLLATPVKFPATGTGIIYCVVWGLSLTACEVETGCEVETSCCEVGTGCEVGSGCEVDTGCKVETS